MTGECCCGLITGEYVWLAMTSECCCGLITGEYVWLAMTGECCCGLITGECMCDLQWQASVVAVSLLVNVCVTCNDRWVLLRSHYWWMYVWLAMTGECCCISLLVSMCGLQWQASVVAVSLLVNVCVTWQWQVSVVAVSLLVNVCVTCNDRRVLLRSHYWWM